ncbi:helix-turn-helix domain-containing protein [Microbulbifer spongiae]|uniref:Helix-turn-helix domain-containing protein n=1 Tax=Microbulbifer spongiae TaxID=2944933 RepID=A0ABY9EDJ7_9GAMM|nr:helix-turn-helix domain-containing protein [Microbulbifer sp. MI-G]WKD51103.1 helix-turn-helix domain-containing protein [Microbulbifer sp. MI-G]
MSMELMAKAMKLKVGNPLRTLVLLELAHNANDQGECRLSYQHIADQCEMSRRPAIRHIKALQDKGFLRIAHHENGQGDILNFCNIFLLTLDKGSEPPASEVNGGELWN